MPPPPSGDEVVAVYIPSPRRYGPRPSLEARRAWLRAPEFSSRNDPMKAEIQSVVDEIQQALSLLRRHL